MADVISFPAPRGCVMEFEISPEALNLVDELRGVRTREEILCECMRRGLNVILREARPDLNPGGKYRGC